MKIVSIWLAAMLLLAAMLPLVASPAHADSGAELPQFEVDAFWP